MTDHPPDSVPQPGATAVDLVHRRAAFADYLHVRLESARAGEALVSLELRPELLGKDGNAHAGVVMTLLENAMAHAALSRLPHEREVVTVDMRVGFMQGAQGRLVAIGHSVGGGKSICFCEARLMDETGEVRSQAMGTFRYLVAGGETTDAATGDSAAA